MFLPKLKSWVEAQTKVSEWLCENNADTWNMGPLNGIFVG